LGKKIVIVACWIGVIALGAFLRLEQLSSRPFHCDEATGARLTAKRLETGKSQFDPQHFHGPILSSLAMPLCRWTGEDRWQTMTKGTLRLVPAVAGILTVLLPLCWRRRWGDAPMLLAAALLATSPLLVYYSRMFIHESMLGLFGILAVMTVLACPKYGLPGLFIGLMFATKESFVISLIAWGAAGVAVAAWNHRSLRRDQLLTGWREYRGPLVWSLLSATVVSAYFYTDGFRQLHGLADAVKTFFIYKTGEGHDKPFYYYLQFLLLPQKSGGVWWYGTPVGLLAVVALAASLSRHHFADARLRVTIQFLALAAAAHFVGYGLIAYKTPWLMVLPWAHVCLLAGFSVAGCGKLRWQWQAGIGVVAGLVLFSQYRQTVYANGRLASDERNPFAYVPTRRNIESVEPWLQEVARIAPGGTLEPIGVVGTNYWPLPWYLRSFHTIGYWPEPPPHLAQLPLVFCVPDTEAAVGALLAQTHTALPRGLRANVPVTLFLRNEIWNAWMAPKPP
jgi:uncharacterized protein (TIGR03663 family)